MKLTILILSLLLSVNSFSSPSNNRLVVKLKNSEQIIKVKGVIKAKKIFGNYFSYTVKDLEKTKRLLEKNENVLRVELNYKSPKRSLGEKNNEFIPNFPSDFQNAPFNDPMVSRIWSFNDIESNGINVNKAYIEHKEKGDGEPIIVAVVDTGVDYNHEDLKDVMWTNSAEIPNNGIDDDENGYIDDVHGINTLSRDNEGNATGNPMDTHSHGTHVSGTIGATQNNNIGIAGIAKHVKIMAIKTVPNSGDETDIDVAESFIYAAKNGAKIINCSFGKRVNEGGNLVADTIDHIAREYGVIVIAAAGNDSTNIDTNKRYPASFENESLLVVGSTSRWGSLSYFSNYGIQNVDVAAPGSSIYSTVPNNRYSSMSGTSMASPTTAGVAAHVLYYNKSLTPIELKERLINTSTPRSSFDEKIKSKGLINLSNALK